jgi:hypothetical protein
LIAGESFLTQRLGDLLGSKVRVEENEGYCYCGQARKRLHSILGANVDVTRTADPHLLARKMRRARTLKRHKHRNQEITLTIDEFRSLSNC